MMSDHDWERIKPRAPVPPPADFEELCAVYGDPRHYMNLSGDIAEHLWQQNILSRAELPWGLTIPWNGQVVSRIACHRLLVDEIQEAFKAIAAAGLRDKVREFGGVYNFRRQRGGVKLSVHSWAAAIDLNITTNPLGEKHVSQGGKADMDMDVVELFEGRKWFWGDVGSVQTASIYSSAAGPTDVAC